MCPTHTVQKTQAFHATPTKQNLAIFQSFCPELWLFKQRRFSTFRLWRVKILLWKTSRKPVPSKTTEGTCGWLNYVPHKAEHGHGREEYALEEDCEQENLYTSIHDIPISLWVLLESLLFQHSLCNLTSGLQCCSRTAGLPVPRRQQTPSTAVFQGLWGLSFFWVHDCRCSVVWDNFLPTKWRTKCFLQLFLLTWTWPVLQQPGADQH